MLGRIVQRTPLLALGGPLGRPSAENLGSTAPRRNPIDRLLCERTAQGFEEFESGLKGGTLNEDLLSAHRVQPSRFVDDSRAAPIRISWKRGRGACRWCISCSSSARGALAQDGVGARRWGVGAGVRQVALCGEGVDPSLCFQLASIG